MPDVKKLTDVFEEARRLVDNPANNFDWSSWEDREAALDEIDELLRLLRAGQLPESSVMETVFAPTGPLQEVGLSSGWGDAFGALADRFDEAIADDGRPGYCVCLVEPVRGSGVELGMDSRYAEVSVMTCPECGRAWLRYYYVNEAFSKSGRWYLGELDKSRVPGFDVEGAKAALESLEWYFYGGSYFDGKTGKSSGPISL